MQIKRHTGKKRGVIISVTAAVLLIICSYLAYAYIAHTWPFTRETNSSQHNTPATDVRESQDVESTVIDRGSTVVNDTGGDDISKASEPTGIHSSSGSIVVTSPAVNSTITDGDTITGSSSYTKVSYRIVDDAIGVLSRGTLNVVDGRFSGRLSLDTNGLEGKIDIFHEDANAREIDAVSIPVRFK